jgi:hypothetical protein
MNEIKYRPHIEVLLGLVICLLVALVLLLAAVPPVSRDALTHHLLVPKLYLKAGGIYEIPEIAFSYYPMNLDLLYMIPLYFGNDILPKYIHFLFALLTAWLIYAFLRERTGQRAYGLLGAALFLSLPVIIKLSITVYVDLGLIYFSAAALIGLLEWISSGYRARHLLISAVFCGLAMGTKYNGLITFFLLTCFIPILYLRSQRDRLRDSGRQMQAGVTQRIPELKFSAKALGWAAVFVGMALLAYSPWMIRNVKWTGNPVYPLYASIFQKLQGRGDLTQASAAQTAEMEVEGRDANLAPFAKRRLVFNETFFEMITTPIRVFFVGRDDDPKFYDGRLNPYLFLFPILAFLGFSRTSSQRRRETLALGLFALLYLLYTFFTVDMRIRYIAPMIPPLVILAALGFENAVAFVGSKMKGRRRIYGLAVLYSVMGLLVGLNAHYIVKQLKYVTPVAYLSGQIDRDDYIQKFRPEYAAMRYINQHLPLDTKILAVYLGNRLYYSDRKMVCNDGFFNASIERADSAGELALKLRARGYDHLLIHDEFFRRFTVKFLGPDKRSMLESFFRRMTRQRFFQHGHALFELIDEETAGVGTVKPQS